MTYPACEGTLKNGERCRSVVASLKGNELERRFCRHHAEKEQEILAQVEADEQAELEPKRDEEVQAELPDVSTAVTAATPSEAIREFSQSRPDLVGEFFQSVLTAEREVWVNCRNCKHKTQAPVPDWSARLKSLQLLLEQGWGRPEPATPDATDDERLEAAVEERLILMEEERYKQVAPLAEHEREILSWPMGAQLAVLQLKPDELADVMAKRGLRHALDNLGGTEGLAEWLARSHEEHKHRCEACAS
jgi:hypothetical protein